MGACILHMVFNQAKKLPPLMAELQSCSDEFEQVVVLPSYEQDPEYLARVLPGVRFRYVELRSRSWSAAQTPLLKLIRFVEFSCKAAVAVREEKPAFSVAHDMPAIPALLPRLILRPERVLYHAHELWSEAAEDNAPLRPLWRMLERWVVRRVRRTVVPEENRARILREEYGAQQLPLLLRNIPAQPEPFTRGNAIREQLGLSADTKIVLYQGLLSESRALLKLIEAVGTLPDSFHLVLAGAGEDAYVQKLQSAMTRAAGRVHILPWMPPDQLRAITASADVGVLLYTNNGRNNYYAAPNKVYEYLFAGLPVVSSAFPGLQKVIEGGDYGSCADPADPGDIARAVREASAITAGEDIADRARAEFRWDDNLADLRALYRDVMEGSHEE